MFDGERLLLLFDSSYVEERYVSVPLVFVDGCLDTSRRVAEDILQRCKGLRVDEAEGVSLDALREGETGGIDAWGVVNVLYARFTGELAKVVEIRFVRGLALTALGLGEVEDAVSGRFNLYGLGPLERRVLLAYRLAERRVGRYSAPAALLHVGLKYVAGLRGEELGRKCCIEGRVLDAQLRWALGGYDGPLDDAAVDRLLGERLGLDCPGGRGRRPAPVTYGDVVAGIAETLNEKPFPEPPVDVESLKEVIMRAFEEGVKNWERMAGERRGQREEEKDGYEGEKE